MDELERRGWLVRVKERGARSDDTLMVEEYKKKMIVYVAIRRQKVACD